MSAVFLGLDVGDVRIGVAISRSGFICEPLLTITRVGRKQTLNELEEIVGHEGVTDMVIGLPRLASGDEGEQAAKTRAFERSLRRRMPHLRYHFQDERYSSADAKDLTGKRSGPDGDKTLIDRVAAAFILQSWLDQQVEKKKND